MSHHHIDAALGGNRAEMLRIDVRICSHILAQVWRFPRDDLEPGHPSRAAVKVRIGERFYP